MGKLIFLTSFLSLFLVQAGTFFEFLEGVAIGYGVSSDCQTSITALESNWQSFLTSIPKSKGSGNALNQLHDFTFALSVTSTTCNLLQIANNIDAAFNTNLLATIIRLVANYNLIKPLANDYSVQIEYKAYGPAGQDIGKIIQYLIG